MNSVSTYAQTLALFFPDLPDWFVDIASSTSAAAVADETLSIIPDIVKEIALLDIIIQLAMSNMKQQVVAMKKKILQVNGSM